MNDAHSRRESSYKPRCPVDVLKQVSDGSHKTAGLWTRLNCNLVYVRSEIHASASFAAGFSDDHANTEPAIGSHRLNLGESPIDWRADDGMHRPARRNRRDSRPRPHQQLGSEPRCGAQFV